MEIKTEILQDLTTVTSGLNVLNLYAELHINVNDNELTFIRECLKNAHLDLDKMKSKNEFKDNRDRELLLIFFNKYLELANLPFDFTVIINEIGCYMSIVYDSKKWQFEHYVMFKVFSKDDALALFNLIVTQVYILKDPIKIYK